MKKNFWNGTLIIFMVAGLAWGASTIAFDFEDPDDDHSTGTINGVTNVLNMVGGYTEGGSTTLTNSIDGNSATATALAADGTDCGTGFLAVGVDASGNALCSAVDDTDGGTDASTQAVTTNVLFDHEAKPSVHHTATVDTFVTNKDTHDHNGGDGAAIDHANLSNVTASQHHTKAVSADIDHDSITGVSTSDHHVATVNTDAESKCAGTTVYLDGEGNCDTLGSGTGDAILSATQTWTGANTYESSATFAGTGASVNFGGPGLGLMAPITILAVSVDGATQNENCIGVLEVSGQALSANLVWSSTITANHNGKLAVLNDASCAPGATCEFIIQGPARVVINGGSSSENLFLPTSTTRCRVFENTFTVSVSQSSVRRFGGQGTVSNDEAWVWVGSP